MKLADNLWLEGPFYVDFDRYDQLRIIGPGNHLFFGSVGLYKNQLELSEVKLADKVLTIRALVHTNELFFHDPAIGHIRKMRQFTEGPKSGPFEKVLKKYPGELAPNYIGTQITNEVHEVTYRRLYGGHWYGVKVEFPRSVEVERVEKRRGYRLKAEEDISFVIHTDTDALPEVDLPKLFKANTFADKDLQLLWDRAGVEIEHLIRNNKTSGVEYGTVFPRDWMESADLGVGDLTPETVNYMYHKSLEHTDDQGRGWHEDSVGEMAAEEEATVVHLNQDLDELVSATSNLTKSIKSMIEELRRLYINRSMIDIEPHYLLGLRYVDRDKLSDDDADHLRRAARYILSQAEEHDLITFKQVPGFFKRHRDHEDFVNAGNWRDSREAFKMVHPVIAPYDVNVVFYPQALRTMLEHAKWLGIDPSHIKPLLAKWDGVRDWFRFTNADGKPGYALALYDIVGMAPGIRYRRLDVNHLDESYDFFYGEPAEVDIIQFCERLIDPNYFYTPSGPILVGANDGFDTNEYHGMVIWAKQAAFTVAGLERQINEYGKKWKPATRKLAQEALTKTAAACVSAFEKLNAIPELHYDKAGEPRLYTDQPNAFGPMNVVQLWSAVGGRRIMRAYKASQA